MKETAAQASSIGPRLRALRKGQKLNMRDFSRLAGVSVGHVSLIERGLIEPSLAVLRKICRALDVSLPLLLTDAAGDLHISGRQTAVHRGFSDSLVTYGVRTPASLGQGAEPQLIVSTGFMPAASRTGDDYDIHANEEFAYVLSGRLEYHTDEGVFALGPGDSIYLEAGVPHLIVNPFDEDAEALIVFSRPADNGR